MDPDEARRRILEELSRGEYAQRRGLLERLLGTIEEWVLSLLGGGGGGSSTAVVIGLGILVLIVAVLLVRRSGGIRRSATLHAAPVLGQEETLDAAELLRLAESARHEGRHDDAAVLAVRSLVADLDRRTLLDVTDGMTAHEAARDAALAFPELRGRLNLAARAFDTAAYSRRSVSVKQAEDCVRLAEYVAQASPSASALETV